MKILNILLSNKRGGLEQAFLNYCFLFQKMNHQPVAVLKAGSPYVERLKASGIEAKELNNYLGALDYLAISRLRKIIRASQSEVVFAHAGRAMVLARLALKKFPYVPLIGVNHSNNVKRSIGCEVVLSVNKQIFYKTVDRGQKPQRSFVMPNILEEEILDPRNSVEIQPLSLSQPFSVPIKLGFLGRLSPEKGVQHLIRALKILNEQNLKTKLVVAGAGGEKPNLQELVCKLGLEKQVEFKGWIEMEQKRQFFKEINIFCLPSAEESFGLVALEAMKYGKPVIATDSDGPSSIITDGVNGLLLKRTAIHELPKAIAEAVIKLADNPPLVSKLVKGAYNNLLQNYSAAAIQDKLDEAIKIALKAKLNNFDG